ncbi:MAG: bifunctional DNA primase/polymerase [Planctomycetes bacterium]|nr:bifunctional DNA primase/polymerase [Planctomycetota bacterium]
MAGWDGTKLDWARRYAGWGWVCLPIRHGTKKAALSEWRHYQRQRPTDAELTKWFGDCSRHELAILCGDISGGLVVRDFDTHESYEAWKAAHPDEAERLPTARTGRGYHVYGTWPEAKSQELDDGELRATGNYVLAPPSRHPSGAEYQWVVTPTGPAPTVDPFRVFSARERNARRRGHTEDTRGQRPLVAAPGGTPKAGGMTPRTEAQSAESDHGDTPPTPSNGMRGLRDHLSSVCPLVSDDCKAAIERAIRFSLPAGPRERNKAVFTFCRALKAIPEVAGWEMGGLVPIVREWHRRAYPNITTKDFGATLADFCNGWPKVEVPLGVPFMDQILERARVAPVPVCANGLGEKIGLLARICAELQAANGGATFFLGCRGAGKLLGTGHDEANRLLRLMVQLKLIEIVTPGTRGRNGDATEYRILW